MPTHSLHRGGPTFPLAAPVVTNNDREKNLAAKAQSPILQGGLVRGVSDVKRPTPKPDRRYGVSGLSFFRVFRGLFDCFGRAHTEESRIIGGVRRESPLTPR